MKKLVKMNMIKFVLKLLDQEYFLAILKSITLLLLTCRNFDRFYLQLLIPMVELLIHNEFTIKDSFNFAQEITLYDSSLYTYGLDVEHLFH